MLLDVTAISLPDILLWLGLATLCGLLLGFEREWRGIVAERNWNPQQSRRLT